MWKTNCLVDLEQEPPTSNENVIMEPPLLAIILPPNRWQRIYPITFQQADQWVSVIIRVLVFVYFRDCSIQLDNDDML